QPLRVSEGNYELGYAYGHDRQRNMSTLKQNGVTTTTRLYLGEMERQTKNGVTKDIHYINAGQGTIGIVVKTGSTYDFYSTYTDHLGSILRVTDDSGSVVAEQNFDAWGRKRNVSTWTYSSVNSVPDWLYRGYTGHEEMPEFRLINMNGRLYDPVVGRMLSVDNHVQSPTNTQSYNRYSYVFNNPLSYTDPNGELAWFIPVIIGAVVGAYAGASIASGGQWNPAKWEKGKWWKGAIVGGFIGAAAGAMATASLAASPKVAITGLYKKGKLVKMWKITTSAIKGANIKLGVTAVTGGDLDKLYKAALVGAALGGFKGAYKATKGFGLAKKWGWKASLAKKAIYSTAESLGGNWINGDKLFYNVVVGVGPLRFTFGKKFGNPVFRWQDNVGSLLPEAISLLNWASGGDIGIDVNNLTLSSNGGWLGNLPELSDLEQSVGWTGDDWLSFIGQYFSKLGSS
ncbi:MAG: RHS repeat-associated core domain-containing protein, partial [Bacteroidota bacterium]